MTEEIKKLIDTKRKIYEQILNLLEEQLMMGGGNERLKIEGTINLIDNIVYNTTPNYNESIINKLNLIKNDNKITLSQAALSSFNRIKQSK